MNSLLKNTFRFFTDNNTEDEDDDVFIEAVSFNDFHVITPSKATRKQTFYTLHFVFEGEGILFFEGKKHRISKGCFFFLPPEKDMLYYPNPNNPWQYIWFELHGPKLPYLGSIMGFSLQKPVIKCKETEKITSSLINMFNNVVIHHQNYYQALSVFYEIVGFLRDSNSAPFSYKKDINHAIVSRAKKIIRLNYNMPDFNIQTLSALLHISHSHLCKIFKNETGLTMIAYLNNVRFKHARILASQQTLSVKEICFAVGFSDEANFMKEFKKRYQSTVKNYKIFDDKHTTK
jgi:AraC-like DNA-binding protein